MSSKISCVMITFNEEENLRRSLESISWCDEIIIVDSGSTDKTLDLCKEFNCKIFYKDFDGYGEQKRFAVSKASNDWIFNIDADEVVTNELRNEIENKDLNVNPDIKGYHILRSLIFLGKQFKYGRESKESYLRLFDKNSGNFSDEKVHEKVEVDGIVSNLSGKLLHYSYKDIDQYFQKFNFYTTQAAQSLLEKGDEGRKPLIIVLSFPFYFIKNYIIYRNFLNGLPGFYWSLFSSLYPVIKYFKLWSFRNQQ